MDRKRSPYKPSKWIIMPISFLLVSIAVIALFLRSSDYISCQGKIEPNTVLPLFAPTDGTIEYSGIEEGRYVDEGDVLLQLDSKLEENALMTLTLEARGYEQDKENLLEQQRLQDEQIETIRAHSNLKTMQDGKLFENNSLTEIDYIDRGYQREQEKMNLIRSQITLQRELSTVENNILLTRLQIARQQKLIEDLVLRSPLSGTLVLVETIYRDPESVNFFSIRPVPGLYIKKGNLVGYITTANYLIAKVVIPERKVRNVEVGEHAKVSLTAYPKSQVDFIGGTLTGISASAQNQEFIGTIQIDIDEL